MADPNPAGANAIPLHANNAAAAYGFDRNKYDAEHPRRTEPMFQSSGESASPALLNLLSSLALSSEHGPYVPLKAGVPIRLDEGPENGVLFVGEGNGSAAEPWVRSNPKRPCVVTEYATEADVRAHIVAKYGDEAGGRFDQRLQFLRGAPNCRVLFGIDATRIHECMALHPRRSRSEGRNAELLNRFPVIMFHMPYATNPQTTGSLVRTFFQSASIVQKPGDRIIMMLLATPDYLFGHYGIDQACQKAGYKEIPAERSTSQPKGYEHMIAPNRSETIDHERIRNNVVQFTFQKT